MYPSDWQRTAELDPPERPWNGAQWDHYLTTKTTPEETMTDYVKHPKMYGSMLLLNVDYNIAIMEEIPVGDDIKRIITIDKDVTAKSGVIAAGTQMEWWFNNPAHWNAEYGKSFHDPKDWALLQNTAHVMPGQMFPCKTQGKPWHYFVGEVDCVPTTSVPTGPGGAPAPAQTAPAAPNPQTAPNAPQAAPAAPQAAPQGTQVTLKDLSLLMTDCWAAAQGKVLESGEFSEGVVQAITSTLFIGAQRRNLDLGYEKMRTLQIAGSGPTVDGEDPLPFN